MELDRETFETQKNPRFGTANPELMNFEFWKWMILAPPNPPREKDHMANSGWIIRDGKFKPVHGPAKARDYFDLPVNPDDGPIWTFHRWGRTRTELPDGSEVFIAGEHEDWYDPDYFVYNDVIVYGPDGELDIYGYPEEFFPPRDGHTSTLLHNQIIIVGGELNLKPGTPTPVYLLNLDDFHIEKVDTSGISPGAISAHSAEFLPDKELIVSGGKYYVSAGVDSRFLDNVEEYSLDIDSWIWQRLTNRNWQQYSIKLQSGEMFPQLPEFTSESILPTNIDFVIQSNEYTKSIIEIDGVPLIVKIDILEVHITLQGYLSGELALKVANEIKNNVERVVKQTCVMRLN